MPTFILAIDQGTTGTTVLIVDQDLVIHAKVNCEFPQHYPQPGWVEHDPEDIWRSTMNAIAQAIRHAGIAAKAIAAIGITNQRETTLLWERVSGRPLARAIVWQDRRTTPNCAQLKKRGAEPMVKKKTGLILDPYFSATKLAWFLDHLPGVRQRATRGDIAGGTIDSFLLWRLTGGKIHATDASNASRTLLMDLATIAWDPELLKLFRIPEVLLPTIVSSSEVYGTTRHVPGLPDGIPIAGMAGDQQAALFGQMCFHAGEAKCTYGTGSFLLLNTGKKKVRSRSGMLTTVAWKLGGEVTYALEGSAFIAGAAVQWLRDGLGLIKHAAQVESLAASVPDSGGVAFVPAFVGLGAPHWLPEARAALFGMTRGTTTAHVARAVLEGIAFLQYDILKTMERDGGQRLRVLKVDGGAAANNLLMQFQSDILGVKLVRPKTLETTALGAVLLAGLAVGVWRDQPSLCSAWQEEAVFTPRMKKTAVARHLATWHAAVRRA